MNDNFWLQLFSFLGVVVVTVVAPIAILYVRVKLKLERQFKEAHEERNSVIDKVAAVHSKLEDVKRANELNLEQTVQFQRFILDSNMFKPDELKKLAEKKRASGFGPLDP